MKHPPAPCHKFQWSDNMCDMCYVTHHDGSWPLISYITLPKTNWVYNMAKFDTVNKVRQFTLSGDLLNNSDKVIMLIIYCYVTQSDTL